MKRSAGFTLIELVIVIVILGILGAVAAPKLFNLQGDAYGANLNAMKSSISTAATMANAKAQIQGQFNATGEDGDFGPGDDGEPTDKGSINNYEGIKFVNGYPAAIKGTTADKNNPVGILGTLESFDEARYTLDVGTPGELTITPKAAADISKCKLTYSNAVAGTTNEKAEPAKVIVDITGC